MFILRNKLLLFKHETAVEQAETALLPLGVCILAYVAGLYGAALSEFFVMVRLSINHTYRNSNTKSICSALLLGIHFTSHGTQPCVQHQ